jgi:isocitrate/isopropylmalate dehydrogenase
MKLAVLPGDDIGPEIVAAMLEVLASADKVFGLGINHDVHEVGMAAHRRLGTRLPDAAMAGVLAADGVLLRPGGMTAYPPLSEGSVNIPGTIRKRLDLFANIRPARSRPNIPKAHPGLDCVTVRENTEGFYADRNFYQGHGEFMPTPDVAMSMRLSRHRGELRSELSKSHVGAKSM